MPETEQERYYRRKNQNMDSSAMLWDAIGESIIAVGMPMLGLFGLVFGASALIDLPFFAWLGISTVLAILLFEFWTKKVMNEW
jgi:hypothetical protein